jgi:hypothetical protein
MYYPGILIEPIAGADYLTAASARAIISHMGN